MSGAEKTKKTRARKEPAATTASSPLPSSASSSSSSAAAQISSTDASIKRRRDNRTAMQPLMAEVFDAPPPPTVVATAAPVVTTTAAHFMSDDNDELELPPLGYAQLEQMEPTVTASQQQQQQPPPAAAVLVEVVTHATATAAAPARVEQPAVAYTTAATAMMTGAPSQLDPIVASGAQQQQQPPQSQQPAATTVASGARFDLRNPLDTLSMPTNSTQPIDERIDALLISSDSKPLQEADFYVVRGLSTQLASDEYERTAGERADLQARLALVTECGTRLRTANEWVERAASKASDEAARRADEYFRHLYSRIAQPYASKLQPIAISRAMNIMWKDLFISEVRDVRRQFYESTRAALTLYTEAPPAIDTPSPALIASAYLEQFVDPVVEKHLYIIETSNYDEQPLLLSTLRSFFERYMVEAAERLATLERGDAVEPFDDERTRELAYFADAIERFATEEMLTEWLPRWIATRPVPSRYSPAALTQLRNFVQGIVERRRRLVATGKLGKYSAFYTPWTEADARNALRFVLLTEVGIRRTLTLPSAAQLGAAVERYFTREVPTPALDPPDMMLHAPLDLQEIIGSTATRLLQAASRAFAVTAETPAVEAAQLVAQQAAAEQRVVARRAALVRQFRLYGAAADRPLAAHAPTDGPETIMSAVDQWTPYDLSYQLDRARSQASLGSAQSRLRLAADDLDANRHQEEAHRLRKALDRHYLERMLERRSAELEYRLNTLLSPYKYVPLVVEREYNDTQPIALTIDIALAPPLAQRIFTRDEARLDAAELVAQRALHESRFEVTWIFKPRDRAQPERVVKRTLLPRTILVDQLVLNGDIMHGATGEESVSDVVDRSGAPLRRQIAISGMYRVEVRREGASSPSVVYPSQFAATVRIVARCARDGCVFEPSLDGDGDSEGRFDCCWTGFPPDEQFTDLVNELVVLVEQGPQAHARLQAERMNGVAAQWRRLRAAAAVYGIDIQLPQPPWGASTALNIMRQRLVPTEELMRHFTFTTIVGKFARRVGAARRFEALRSNNTALVALLNTMSDEEAFLDYAARVSDEMTAATIASLTANAAHDYVETQPDVPAVPTDFARLFAERGADINAAQAVAVGGVVGGDGVAAWHRVVPTEYSLADDEVGERVALRREVQYTGRPLTLDSIGIQRLYHYLSQPAVRALATARELTFFGASMREYERYRLMARTAFLRQQDEYMKAIDIDAYLAGATLYRTELDARNVLADGARSMFIDTASFAEFESLANALRRKYVGNEQLPSIVSMADVLWTAPHNTLSAQPPHMVLYFSGAHALDPDIPTNVRIWREGAQPSDRGVDFDGLRDAVLQACNAYEHAVKSPATTPAEAASALEWSNVSELRLHARLRREQCESTVLIYNYFAFIAPRQSTWLSAHRIYQLLANGAMKHLSFAPPLRVIATGTDGTPSALTIAVAT